MTLIDLRKLSERDSGKGSSENMWDIFTSLSPNIPLGTAVRQMPNIHLLLLSPVVRNWTFSFIYIFMFSSFFFLLMFVVLCVLACVLSAQLWFAGAPETAKQQRDQTQSDVRVNGEAKTRT